MRLLESVVEFCRQSPDSRTPPDAESLYAGAPKGWLAALSTIYRATALKNHAERLWEAVFWWNEWALRFGLSTVECPGRESLHRSLTESLRETARFSARGSIRGGRVRAEARRSATEGWVRYAAGQLSGCTVLAALLHCLGPRGGFSSKISAYFRAPLGAAEVQSNLRTCLATLAGVGFPIFLKPEEMELGSPSAFPFALRQLIDMCEFVRAKCDETGLSPRTLAYADVAGAVAKLWKRRTEDSGRGGVDRTLTIGSLGPPGWGLDTGGGKGAGGEGREEHEWRERRTKSLERPAPPPGRQSTACGAKRLPDFAGQTRDVLVRVPGRSPDESQIPALLMIAADCLIFNTTESNDAYLLGGPENTRLRFSEIAFSSLQGCNVDLFVRAPGALSTPASPAFWQARSSAWNRGSLGRDPVRGEGMGVAAARLAAGGDPSGNANQSVLGIHHSEEEGARRHGGAARVSITFRTTLEASEFALFLVRKRGKG